MATFGPFKVPHPPPITPTVTASTWNQPFDDLDLILTSDVAGTGIYSGGDGMFFELTLTGSAWVSGAAFDAVRQSIINGIVGSSADPAGWNSLVSPVIQVTDVVRLYDTLIRVNIPKIDGYGPSATESINITVPAAAIVGAASDVVVARTWSSRRWIHWGQFDEPTRNGAVISLENRYYYPPGGDGRGMIHFPDTGVVLDFTDATHPSWGPDGWYKGYNGTQWEIYASGAESLGSYTYDLNPAECKTRVNRRCVETYMGAAGVYGRMAVEY